MKEIRCLCGLVLKNDWMSKHLTPREIITNSAKFRLGDKMSSEFFEKRVEDVIRILRLETVADTFIKDFESSFGSQIAKKFRKRTLIAAEMVRDCSVVVVENPTFGMGYEEQVDIISALKSIAKTGKIVIVTLEQPSVDILRQFDKMLIL